MASKIETDFKVSEKYDDLSPPPPYDETTESDTSSGLSEKNDLDHFGTQAPHEPISGGIKFPIVIPQETTSKKGAFNSPFVRAYVPELQAHGIKQDEFLTFIDGMNECFIAHPVFAGLNVVGGVMGMAYGVDPVQWAGAGLQVASGVASAATSYVRTRAYVKAINRDLFHPAGLHLNVLTTKKMMEKVGYPEEKLQLPPLESMDDIDPKIKLKDAVEERLANTSIENDPRMRRLRALEGYVMPIELNQPPTKTPDNLLRKMGAAQAKKQASKQERKMIKKQTKAQRKQVRNTEKVDRRKDRTERRTEQMHREFEQETAELQRQATEDPDQRRREKAAKQLEKEKRKMEKDLEKLNRRNDKVVEKRQRKADEGLSKIDEKETKTANKVRWLVLHTWTGDDDSDADSLPESESEVKE